jgi:hypothetical protein
MKMRNFFAWAVILMTTIIMASCSQSADYQSVIPTEPVLVVKANVNNLLSESEILQDNQVAGFLKGAINEIPENSRELMRGILDDPSNCGLDLKQPAFVVMENFEQAKGFVLFAVKDAEQVKTLLNAMLENEEEALLEEKGDYTLLKADNANVMAFDDTKLVVAFAQGAYDATEYFTAADNSNKSSALKEFITSNDDMSYYIAYKDILRLAEAAAPEAVAMTDTKQLEDAIMICNINFENGKIVIDGKMEGAKELMDNAKKNIAEVETDLQKFIPTVNYAFMQSGAKDIISSIPEAQRQTLEDALAKANEELKQKGINAELTTSALNSLDGGIIFGISEADKSSILPIPQMVLMAECKDDALFKLIIEVLKSENLVIKSSENVYSIMNLYNIAYVDNKIVVMPSTLFSQCCADGSTKELSENIHGKELSKLIGDKSGIAIDAQAVAQILEEMGLAKSKSDKAMLNILRKFSYTTLTTNEDCEVEWIIAFQDANTNALKQIKDMAISSAISSAF